MMNIVLITLAYLSQRLLTTNKHLFKAFVIICHFRHQHRRSKTSPPNKVKQFLHVHPKSQETRKLGKPTNHLQWLCPSDNIKNKIYEGDKEDS